MLVVFHYLPLHSSPVFQGQARRGQLSNYDHFAETLVHLPLYHDLTEDEVREVSRLVLEAVG